MVTMYRTHTIEQEEDGYQTCKEFGLKLESRSRQSKSAQTVLNQEKY